MFKVFFNKEVGKNHTEITPEFGMGLELNDETAILSDVDSYDLKSRREHTVCLDAWTNNHTQNKVRAWRGPPR